MASQTEQPMSSRRRALAVVFLLAAGAMVASSLPLWWALARTPEQGEFLWSLDTYDNNTYFAKMRPGFRGEWLTVNLYDTTDHEPVLLFPFHVLLGHAARLADALGFGGSGQLEGLASQGQDASAAERARAWRAFPKVYNLARTAGVFALVWMIYWFAGMVTNRPSRRLWAVALAMFAGGWGTSANTEAHILKSCVQYPNFVVSLVFYVLACGAFLRAMRRPEQWKRCAAWAAVAGFGLGWVHPFDAPPLAAIGGVALVVRWVAARRFPWTLLVALGAFCVFTGGPIAYQLHVRAGEQMFQIIDMQNQLRWDRWWQWMAMLDVYALVALAGVAALSRRWRRPEALFVMVWIVVGIAMLHAPVKFQRRMIEGLPIGLAFGCVAAVEGWGRLLWTRRRGNAGTGREANGERGRGGGEGRRRVRLMRHGCYAVLLVALLPRTVWVFYERGLLAAPKDSFEHYLGADEVEAMEWLAANTDWREPVWASRERSNLIPFLAGNRVFYGHDVETTFSQSKRVRTLQLLGGQMTVADFRDIVKRCGIRYLYIGPVELARGAESIGAFDKQVIGKPVYRKGMVSIYRLRAP